MEDLHTCERTGSMVRAELVDVICAIEARNLKGRDRAAVLDAIAAADVTERRYGQNAGARYLITTAEQPTTSSRQAEVLRRCATTFIRRPR
jgi:hypothetical protein